MALNVIYPQPHGERAVRDMSKIQSFSFQINDTAIDAYTLKISNLSGTQLYTSGKTTLSPVRGVGDLVTHDVPVTSSIANNNFYNWTVKIYRGTESTVDANLKLFRFRAQADPTITMDSTSTITNVSHTFTDTYVQINDPIEFYEYKLYTSDGNLIHSTGKIGNTLTGFKYDLYNSNTSYYRILEGVTLSGNAFKATSVTFDVSYSEGNFDSVPIIEIDDKSSFVTVRFGQSINITGSVSGGSVTYNNGVVIPNGVTVLYDGVGLGSDFMIRLSLTLPVAKDGIILSNSVTNSTYIFGFDGVNNHFYLDNNGYRIESSHDYLNQIQFPIEVYLMQFSFVLKQNGVYEEVSV